MNLCFYMSPCSGSEMDTDKIHLFPSHQRVVNCLLNHYGEHNAMKVSEMIYRGTLPTFDAAQGEVHQVSPRARPVSTLRKNQTGIKQIYMEIEVASPSVPLEQLLEKVVKARVQKAIRNIFGETFVGYAVEAIQDLVSAKIVHDVVGGWCAAKGKRRLKDLSVKLKIQNIVSHIKQLLRLDSPHKERRVKEFCEEFDAISKSIVSGSPTTEGFVNLFLSYVEANRIVHKMPTTEQLKPLERQLQKGETFGVGKASSEWLLFMTKELLSSRQNNLGSV